MNKTAFSAAIRLAIAIVAMLVIRTSVLGQTGGQTGPADGAGLPPADLNRIKVGEPAPDFTLENLDGTRVTLSDLRGKKNVVLVFYRGYW